jgi:hypothetical protein
VSATTKPNNAQQFSIPYGSSANVGRIDQGVDISQKRPFSAVAAGTIVYIDPNFYKGTPAVYERLDQPITVNGRTYTEVYYAETAALVKVGQHVTPGELVTAGGDAEIGFASGNLPAGHAQHIAGGDATVTTAGKDFSTFLRDIGSGVAVAVGPDLGSAAKSVGNAISGGIFGPLESWLTGVGKTVLAYVLLVGVAGGLFLTGLKGLGVKPPKVPAVVPV